MSKSVMMDAQAALGFVVGQTSHVEGVAVKRLYPEIRYRERVFVDTSANPFASSVTFFSQDMVGKAKFMNGKGDDVPLVNILGTKFEQGINLGGVGYSFSLEEIGQAQMLGMSLSAEGAIAARYAFESLADEVVHIGNTAMGIEGLTNMSGIDSGAAGVTFEAATADQALAVINTALSGIWSDTSGIDQANTVLIPIASLATLATKRIGTDSTMTVLEYIKRANVWTATTGQPLQIEATHHLTTKMVVYRNDPSVVKMHMPMPLMFAPPQARGLQIDVNGMFRFAPINIRRPKAVRYVTGVHA